MGQTGYPNHVRCIDGATPGHCRWLSFRLEGSPGTRLWAIELYQRQDEAPLYLDVDLEVGDTPLVIRSAFPVARLRYGLWVPGSSVELSVICREVAPLTLLSRALAVAMGHPIATLQGMARHGWRKTLVHAGLGRAMPSSIDSAYRDWVERFDTVNRDQRAAMEDHIARMTRRPTFTLIAAPNLATKASLHGQIYPHWELCSTLDEARGDFVAFLEPGAILSPHALYMIAAAIEARPDLGRITCDIDEIDLEGRRRNPRFGTAACAGPFVVTRLGPAPSMASTRVHVPWVLYHRPPGQRIETRTARLADPDPWPKVSLIVPTRDRVDLMRVCAAGVLTATDYPDLELIVIDNDSVAPSTHTYLEQLRRDTRVRVIRYEGPFNFARMNNQAARLAQGDLLVLLNNDIEIRHPHWLKAIARLALQGDVGAVGAKLLYADGMIQHGGVVLGLTGLAGHLGQGARPEDPDLEDWLHATREVAAVTGACLAIRRAVFDAVGGMDETHLTVAYNDIDLCLKLSDAGYRILWTPEAELIHHESKSRGSDRDPAKAARLEFEIAAMRERWGDRLLKDRFFSSSLSLETTIPTLAFPPRRRKPWL